MKRFASILVVAPLLISLSCNASDEKNVDLDILAERGKGVVTQEMFTARANQIPADIRAPTLRNGNRLRDVINSMLLRSQLAADARAAGFDKEKIVIDRMQMAAENELAEAWLDHYVEIQPDADYEQLAREQYLLIQETTLSLPKIDVSHILVATEERSDEDAKALADDIYRQLQANPDRFEDLVVEFSEDPSAKSNRGVFKSVKTGDMVKPFEEVAFALQPGQISTPVKTEYGYHIIRLDAYYPPRKQTFEEVKEQLMRSERNKHDERVRREYLESLTGLEVQMSEEQLGEMVRRNFGDNAEDPEAKADDSE